MEQRVTDIVGELELLIARLVDNYVMTVTESLCAMENDNPRAMGQSGLVAQRAHILARLDVLDGLAADLRDCRLRNAGGDGSAGDDFGMPAACRSREVGEAP